MSDVLSVKEVRALCAVTGARLTQVRIAGGLWRVTVVRDGFNVIEWHHQDITKAARAAWMEYVKYLDSR